MSNLVIGELISFCLLMCCLYFGYYLPKKRSKNLKFNLKKACEYVGIEVAEEILEKNEWPEEVLDQFSQRLVQKVSILVDRALELLQDLYKSKVISNGVLIKLNDEFMHHKKCTYYESSEDYNICCQPYSVPVTSEIKALMTPELDQWNDLNNEIDKVTFYIECLEYVGF